MAKEYRHDIDLRHNILSNAKMNPSASTPVGFVQGELYLNTTDAHLKAHDGTSEKNIPFSGTATPSSISVGAGSVGTSKNSANEDHAHPAALATTISDGLMSGTDKALLVAATDAATASTLMRRDASGRAKVADPSAAQDIATKNYVDTRRLDQFAAPTTSVSMNNQRITNLLDPTSAQDAATKNYVDASVQGLKPKSSTRVGTVGANITLAGGAVNVLDGVTLALNDRILVKDQSAPAQNGIYTVTTLGTGANGTWTRAGDADTWAELVSAYVFIEQGTINADNAWLCTSDQGGTLGTTAVTWIQFSGAGQIVAGAALTKTGNTLDVAVDNTTIEVNTDALRVKTDGTHGGLTHIHIAAANKDGVAGTASMRTLGTGAQQAAAGNHLHTGTYARMFIATIGNGTNADLTVTHNLGTKNLVAEVYRTATPWDTVEVEIKRPTTNTVTVTILPIATANEFTIVIFAQ